VIGAHTIPDFYRTVKPWIVMKPTAAGSGMIAQIATIR
jgi:hypothetical protein